MSIEHKLAYDRIVVDVVPCCCTNVLRRADWEGVRYVEDDFVRFLPAYECWQFNRGLGNGNTSRVTGFEPYFLGLKPAEIVEQIESLGDLGLRIIRQKHSSQAGRVIDMLRGGRIVVGGMTTLKGVFELMLARGRAHMAQCKHPDAIEYHARTRDFVFSPRQGSGMQFSQGGHARHTLVLPCRTDDTWMPEMLNELSSDGLGEGVRFMMDIGMFGHPVIRALPRLV